MPRAPAPRTIIRTGFIFTYSFRTKSKLNAIRLVLYKSITFSLTRCRGNARLGDGFSVGLFIRQSSCGVGCPSLWQSATKDNNEDLNRSIHTRIYRATNHSNSAFIIRAVNAAYCTRHLTSSATEIVACIPELNSRKSCSIPSEKITPFSAILERM